MKQQFGESAACSSSSAAEVTAAAEEEGIMAEFRQCRSVVKEVSDFLRTQCISVVSLAQQWRTLRRSLKEESEVLERKENEIFDRLECLEAEEERVVERGMELERREREVEERLAVVDAAERGVEVRFEVVEEKEKVVEERFEVVESKEMVVEKRFEEVEAVEMEVKERVEKAEAKEREVEERVRSTEREIEERFEVVELKETEVGKRFVDVGSKEKEIEEQFRLVESKAKEVDELCKVLKSKEKVIVESFALVESKQREIKERFDGLEAREKGVEERFVAVEAREKDLEVKTKQFNDRRKSLELWEKEIINDNGDCPVPESGWCDELELKQKQVDERLVELESRETQLNERSRVLELENGRFEKRVMELETRENGVESRERQLNERSRVLELEKGRIEKWVMELETREKKVESKLKEGNEQRGVIIIEENRLSRGRMELDRRKRDLEMKETKLNEDYEGLKAKERELDERMKVEFEDLEAKKKLVREFWEQINLVDRLRNERAAELDSQETQIRNTLRRLESQEKQNREQSEDLELKRIQIEAKQKEIDERIQERDLTEKETVDVPMTEPAEVVADGETLLSLLNDRVDEHSFMGEYVRKALKSYEDPAELVLSAVNGFFAARTVRSSCVLLLEQLMKLRPEVCRNARVKAEETACVWRQKMQESGEKRVVVLGFLLLVAGFGLRREFDRDELRRLWAIIEQHRLAFQLRIELDLFDECHQVFSEDSEEDSNSEMNDMDPCNELQSACTDMKAITLKSYLNKHVINHKLFPQKIIDALKSARDPAKLVFKVLQTFNLPQSTPSDKTSCIFLLQHLRKLQKHQSERNPLGNIQQVSNANPPLQITQDMRIQALAFASRWKCRLAEESPSPLDVYGFLQFVASYRLASLYDGDEVLQLFKVLYDAKPVFWPDENPQLCRALGLTDKIPGLITSLIDENCRLQAAKYICAFMEEPRFPLALLLKDHVRFVQERVVRIQGITADKSMIKGTYELSHLKEVLQYIKDYKLEQECSSLGLESRIIQLEATLSNLKPVSRVSPETTQHRPTTLPVTNVISPKELDSNERGKRLRRGDSLKPSSKPFTINISSNSMLPRSVLQGLQPCPLRPTVETSESQHPAQRPEASPAAGNASIPDAVDP